MPRPAVAQQQAEPPANALQEVVVTANRREQTLEEVPYNLSVVSADTISNASVTDIASLARQVPGLSFFDIGARMSGALTPIIRGINASDLPVGNRAFRTFEQAPVGTYFGNSPFDGYFQLDDIQRVEVLRGPQGTLYGAGALGGAIRIIPNPPELNAFSGHVEGSVGSLAHSSGTPYSASGTFNVPIGDTLAIRLSGKYAYEPGFIDVYGILKRTGPFLYGIPVLANPTDPVNSPGVYSGRKDFNDQSTFTGRASALWKPAERFSAEFAFTYSNLTGNGGPETNPLFPGGPFPFDTRITFPSGSPYQAFHAEEQPYSRKTDLTSLDLSYDAGFATLSATSSYYTTNGSTAQENSYGVEASPFGAVYYAGIPANPRFIRPFSFDDSAHTFTQEVRLVSATGPDKSFDYVVGAFYENQTRKGDWIITDPGSPERAVAEGCTSPVFFGASFPNCLIVVGPNDTVFVQADTQNFQDKSVFGELTWHFLKKGQITFGGRHFEQEFTDAQSYTDYTFPPSLPATPHNSSASKNTWKINPSYEYATDQHVYAIWSQGFRRGGANSVPLTGYFKESPLLATYAPDSVDNYEAGLKGRFANGLRYSIDVFDIEWDKPQISTSLPSGNFAVYNANKARSTGVEFETTGPLGVSGLGYAIGGSYTDAKLTEPYSLPANNGVGVITPGELTGTAGEQLPGSPKVSAAATITFDRSVMPGYDLGVSLNATYKGAVPIVLAKNLVIVPGTSNEAEAYTTVNFSAALSHKGWRLTAYATNLLDKRANLYPLVEYSFYPPNVSSLLASTDINPPREIGFRIAYSFRSD